MSKKPWETKEWKLKRAQFINEKGGKCEVCGSTEKLSIAHPIENVSKFNLIGYILKNDERYKHLFYHVEEVCPKCSSSAIYTRQVIKPTYRCPKCGSCFEKEEIKKEERVRTNCSIAYPLYNDPKNEEFRKWADKVWEDYKKKRREEYMSFESVRLLCMRCHCAEHHYKDLCPVCKKKYKNIGQKTCFDCNPDKDKILAAKKEEERMEEIIEKELDMDDFEDDGEEYFQKLEENRSQGKKEAKVSA